MANSPLITMPLLNGILPYDYGDKPNPANIFGNIAIGIHVVYQDVPTDFCFYGELVSGSGAVCGTCGEETGISLKTLDFYSIWDPSISAARDLKGFIANSPRPGKSSCLLLTPSTIRADYAKVMPVVTPYYGESRPNFSVWSKFYREEWGKLTLWEIVYSKYVYFRILCPILLYSRFANQDNIRKFIWFKQVEYPAGTGTGSHYFYGVAEAPEMVPAMWGARPVEMLMQCVAINNLDIFYYMMYKYNVFRDLNSLKRVLFNVIYPMFRIEQNGINYNRPELSQPLIMANNLLAYDTSIPFINVYYNQYILKNNCILKILNLIRPDYCNLGTLSGCENCSIHYPNDMQFLRTGILMWIPLLLNATFNKKYWFLDYEAMWAAFRNGFVPPGGNY